MSKTISDADIADLLAEMSSSYEGEAVERKNRAIRNGAAALRQLMAQRDEARAAVLAEREACAKECERIFDEARDRDAVFFEALLDAASAIRLRSRPTPERGGYK